MSTKREVLRGQKVLKSGQARHILWTTQAKSEDAVGCGCGPLGPISSAAYGHSIKHDGLKKMSSCYKETDEMRLR